MAMPSGGCFDPLVSGQPQRRYRAFQLSPENAGAGTPANDSPQGGPMLRELLLLVTLAVALYGSPLVGFGAMFRQSGVLAGTVAARM